MNIFSRVQVDASDRTPPQPPPVNASKASLPTEICTPNSTVYTSEQFESRMFFGAPSLRVIHCSDGDVVR